jgi:2-oxoisovalerate dehydrogenase E1 component
MSLQEMITSRQSTEMISTENLNSIPAQSFDAASLALVPMELIRAFEERLLSLFSEGKIFGTTHTCIGQEVCAVSVLGALDLQKDIVFSNHRCHGHFLVYSDNPEALVAEIMGRQTGVCGGRGGSQHLCLRNFYSNGIQGGIVPVATGMALAEKLKCTNAVTVCFLGDGTLGEGAVYEALNLASLWRLPILYVLEHNQYAQSTPTALTTAGDIAARAAAFGIASDRRSADDPVSLNDHLRTVVDAIRNNGKPFFQILDTYRLAAHSKGDDDRDPKEIEHYRRNDPLLALRILVGETRARAAVVAAHSRVDAAVAAAEAAPHAVVDAVSEQHEVASRGRGASGEQAFATENGASPPLVVHCLNQALHSLMESHQEVLLIGEDLLDPYGGAFKVSRGLSSRFPSRVLTTPISEAAIVGLGSGLGMRGLKPIVEIMFGDLLPMAADQIVNHLAKFHWMYNGQVETPVVIRTPVGGRRGYGPTHSQSIEKMFFGVPGLVVVGVSLRHDPGELLRRAVAEDRRPVLFIEQKILYAKRLRPDPPPGLVFELHESERDALYPTGTWRPLGTRADITVVTYGAMTEIVEAGMAVTFESNEIVVEYIVPSQLAPLRIEPITDSVRRTGRLLVVEEAAGPWGFGAEVLARVTESLQASAWRGARVAAHPLTIPSARSAEEIVLPGVQDVVDALRRLLQ